MSVSPTPSAEPTEPTERPEPAERGGPRRARTSTQTRVVRTEQLTPHMVRVVLGGEALTALDPTAFTDRYVKLQFPPEVEGQRERLRTYTIRSFDAAAGELALDFVIHGDEGLAGPWAAAAQPGDPMSFAGPGGAYAPSAAADWHLFIGDESALPAIAAALEVLPAGARAKVFCEVGGPDDEQELVSAAQACDADLITWVHRTSGGSPLVDTVTAWTFPEGTPEVFLHGDAGFVKDLRRHLRGDRGVPVSALSASGYWRRGRTEEGWRSDKASWKAAVDSDEAKLISAEQA
ncbi:NADPH-dependent ferric siderophore reductase, contains FAD-binding and SIP domains [Sanguibacter gelidistatuariae]|uniref:NADPH-dependent ferric siderophore reductase, contains FAD-binding and SIP domains n=1 Tax=Sanguibacter gelidistatuariae TaxID=1814289 RepID=A0A1G6MLP0_9MICO|nr:siderophore-interacting protein [Sanguibacter gelidistatuariae]SDC55906.1 NADPH-dependent ferric siderophore reductase, contains FAD-binding and SIP domains [Sanguibacter gelidistatuariae]